MAQGGGASASYPYEDDDDEIPSFIMFLKSPIWLYPISRFLGHAIHYCRYEFDFLEQDEQQEERNLIIFGTYRDLVGSLLSRYCKEYDIKPSKVVEEILEEICKADSEPGSEPIHVRSFNFIRATYKMPHFAYMIMSYCSLFKVKCLEDVVEEIKQMKLDDSQKEKWQELWMYLHEEMVIVAKGQNEFEKSFSDHTKVMLREMQYGPFLYCYGIKLSDSALSYHPNLDKLLDSTDDLKRRKALLSKGVPEEDKLPTEDIMRDDLVKLFRITKEQVMEKLKTPPPSSARDLHELNKSKAEGLEILEQTLTQSPASKEHVTVSERLAVQPETQQPEGFAKSKKKPKKKSPEPQYVTAPSSPEKTQPMQIAEEPVIKSTKSRKKRSSKSPKPECDIAASMPAMVKSEAMSEFPQELTNVLAELQIERSPSPKLTAASSFQIAEEPVTEPTTTKPRKKRSTKSPIPRCDTALSMPTVVKSKAQSESPREVRKVLAGLQIKRTPSPKLAAASSFVNLTLPVDESGRKEFVLNAYDRRLKKQLGFMAAIFELQKTIGLKKGFRDLIVEQRWFEKYWPSPQSKTKPGDKDEDDTKDSIAGTAAGRREMKMLNDVLHGEVLFKLLWNTFKAKIKSDESH